MKKTFFAFVFSLLCAVAGSQDTVVVYLDKKFSISLKELATYRREAVVVNNLNNASTSLFLFKLITKRITDEDNNTQVGDTWPC